MNIRYLNTNGNKSVNVSTPSVDMWLTLNPDLSVVDSLQADIISIDDKIRRLQKRRALISQAMQTIKGGLS